MLILSHTNLQNLLKMPEVIDAVEGAFHALARGAAIAPERLHMEMPAQKGVLLEMPAHIQAIGDGEKGLLGTKIVSVFERNAERNLDIVQAIYVLLDAETGAPIAFMDGRFITAIRTAAASAVATKHLASGGQKVLAVFGAGVQARFHIEAMIEVATVERVLIASRATIKADALAEFARLKYGIECYMVSAEEAVSAADLICACTSSPVPLFDGRLIKPGAHINAVGAFTPTTRELDTEAVGRARVIIDAESAAGREAGDLLIPILEGAIKADHVAGTLADVLSGKTAGRKSKDDITLFKSCGLAIEDLVTAQLAYAKARETSTGVDVTL